MTLLLVSDQEMQLTLNQAQREKIAQSLRVSLILPEIGIGRYAELLAGNSDFITHSECRALIDQFGSKLLDELVKLGW